MKIAFAGSPEFADAILLRLIKNNYKPVAVFTQPDKGKGRGRKVVATPVKQRAEKFSIPVLQPRRMREEEAQTALANLKTDFLVVAAYGQILPQAVLDLPRFGCLNVHASLLPRWRGAAPIERAVMAGDHITGVTIMHMEAGLDTGPTYVEASLPIVTTGERQLSELEADLAQLGADLLIQVLDRFAAGDAPTPSPQPDTGVTYADKLNAEDREVDWHGSAEQIQRKIWALRDRLPARVQLGGVKMQLLEAQVQPQVEQNNVSQPGCLVDATKHGLVIQCATDLLRVTSLRLEKGKGTVLSAAEALNGHRNLFLPGHTFYRTDC